MSVQEGVEIVVTTITLVGMTCLFALAPSWAGLCMVLALVVVVVLDKYPQV